MLSTLEKLNAGNCQSQDLNSNLLTPPETLFSLYFYSDQTYQIAQSFILNYHGPPDLPCMEHIWLGIYVQDAEIFKVAKNSRITRLKRLYLREKVCSKTSPVHTFYAVSLSSHQPPEAMGSERKWS